MQIKQTPTPKAKQVSHDWVKWILGIIIVILVGYIIYHYISNRPLPLQGATTSEITLKVKEIAPQSAKIEKKYVGYITPISDVSITPKISGFLKTVNVSGGQEVQTGDLLLVIDQGEYNAQVAAADAAVKQAQADYANAEIYYNRMQKAGTKAISKTELDNAQASYLSAQAALAQAQANYELSKVNLSYTEIRAPISGIIGEVSLTQGDYVSPSGQKLFSIISYSPIRVVFAISDKDYLEEVKKGAFFKDNKIQLRLSDGSLYQYLGQYRYSDNQVTKSTGSVSVYADFENPDKILLSNAYVDVLVEKNYKDVILINKQNIEMSSNGNFVNVVNQGRLEKRKINILGAVGADNVAENTFNSGDYLVVEKVSPKAFSSQIKMDIVGNREKK